MQEDKSRIFSTTSVYACVRGCNAHALKYRFQNHRETALTEYCICREIMLCFNCAAYAEQTVVSLLDHIRYWI